MRIEEDGLTTFSGPGMKLNRTGGEAYLFFQKEGTDRGSIYGGANQSGLRLYGSTGDPILTLTDTAVESRENITLAEGKGITFGSVNTPAQTNGTGTSNTLDDYEEGTWTPNLTFGDSASGVTLDTGATTGFYTKVGRIVHITFKLKLTAHPSSGGTARIGALPFTVGDADHNFCGYSHGFHTDMDNTPNVGGYLNQTYHDLVLVNATTTNDTADLNHSHFTNTTVINGSATYVSI
jgi:hypothetical protein